MTGKRIAEYHGAGADRFVRGKFIAVVADPTAAGDEEHRSGDKVGKTQGIVAGAAHHAVRLCAEAAGGLFQFVHQLRGHGPRQVFVLPGNRDLNPALFRDVFRGDADPLFHAAETAGHDAARVDAEFHPARDDVHHVGIILDDADGGDAPEASFRLSDLFDRQDQFSGGAEGIAPHVHGGRPGMVCLTVDDDASFTGRKLHRERRAAPDLRYNPKQCYNYL